MNHCPMCTAPGVSMSPVDALEAGGFCVCTKCGVVMILDVNLTPRGMTTPELNQLMQDPAIVQRIAGMIVASGVARHLRN